MRLIASARVAALLLNRPRTAEVIVSDPGFFTPAHRHAEVLGLDHHQHAARVERVDQRVGDLGGEALLHLRPLGEAVDQPGDLRQPGDPAVVAGDVGHVGAPGERNEMVLAHAGHGDVAHHDHLVVVGLERDREVVRRVLVDPGEDLLVHVRDARRRADEPVAIRVFADGFEDLAHRALDPLGVDR